MKMLRDMVAAVTIGVLLFLIIGTITIMATNCFGIKLS